MKKTFCDCCFKEITGSIHKIGFGVVENGRVEKEDMNIEDEMDFCDDCVHMIANAIRNGSISKAAPKASAKPAQKVKKQNAVDAPKIWSLKDAGWKVSAIAAELGCSEQSVYNVLKRPRPEMEQAYNPEAEHE